MNHDLLRLEGDMEKDLPPFAEALRSVQLSHAEKDRMLSAIFATPPSYSFSLFFTLRQTLALSLVVMILAGSSASYAAESSLPGEFLYPIKVGVNEQVRVALARSDQDKASIQALLAQRRLEEGETLAERGELTDETRAEIALRFHNHASRATERFAALSDSEADAAVELSTNFEATLNAHEEMLARFVREDDFPNAIVNGLLSEVRGMARVARKTRVLAREKVRMIADAGKMRDATFAATGPANEQIEGSGDSSIDVQAAGKLALTKEAGNDILNQVDAITNNAFDSVSSALSMAQDAGAMMKNMKLMNVDSADGPPSDGWDPMTQIRASAQINVLVTRIDGARKLLEKSKADLTEDEIHKANIELTLADSALLNARAKMETAEYDESKKIADQGIEIIMKARKIIKGQPLDAPEENESSAGASTSIDSQSYTSISADGTSIKVEQKTEIHTEVNIGQ